MVGSDLSLRHHQGVLPARDEGNSADTDTKYEVGTDERRVVARR